MIKINASLKKLVIDGHANSDQIGKDLVCAGVSSIFCGAIQIWNQNPRVLIQQTDDGFISIDWKNIDWSQEEKLKNEYFFSLKLVQILKKNYPNYIKINNIDFIE